MPLAVVELEMTGAAGWPAVELRGLGAEAEKSAALLAVSVAPPAARKRAVVLEPAGAAEPS